MKKKKTQSPEIMKSSEEDSSSRLEQFKTQLIKKGRKAKGAFPAPKARSDDEAPVALSEPVFQSSDDLKARIATRAYELYERRGGHHGQDLDDWLQAEKQVMSELT